MTVSQRQTIRNTPAGKVNLKKLYKNNLLCLGPVSNTSTPQKKKQLNTKNQLARAAGRHPAIQGTPAPSQPRPHGTPITPNQESTPPKQPRTGNPTTHDSIWSSSSSFWASPFVASYIPSFTRKAIFSDWGRGERRPDDRPPDREPEDRSPERPPEWPP